MAEARGLASRRRNEVAPHETQPQVSGSAYVQTSIWTDSLSELQVPRHRVEGEETK